MLEQIQIKSQITHLECSLSGESCSHEVPTRLNPKNGKPYLARYDLSKAAETLTKESLLDREPNMWRYREVMPVINPEYVVTLGEGFTPLAPAKRLGKHLGMSSLLIKDEGVNPTGSFKARGLSAAVSKALELGQTKLTMPSAGKPAETAS